MSNSSSEPGAGKYPIDELREALTDYEPNERLFALLTTHLTEIYSYGHDYRVLYKKLLDLPRNSPERADDLLDTLIKIKILLEDIVSYSTGAIRHIDEFTDHMDNK